MEKNHWSDQYKYTQWAAGFHESVKLNLMQEVFTVVEEQYVGERTDKQTTDRAIVHPTFINQEFSLREYRIFIKNN